MARAAEKGLVAKKIGMSRMVDSQGKIIAVTLLQVEKQRVTKILTPERDGYSGFQVGYATKAEKNLTKADITRLRKSNISENYSRFCEIRTPVSVEGFELGHEVGLSLLEGVSVVDVTGITKGRGFQGAVRRFNSKIGRMSHGSRFHRRPGSLGQRTTPGRVFKNKHQPGHMGCDRVTLKNLRVVDFDVASQVLAIKGSVPGHREGYVEIRPSKQVAKAASSQA